MQAILFHYFVPTLLPSAPSISPSSSSASSSSAIMMMTTIPLDGNRNEHRLRISAFCPPDHHHNRDFLKRCRCWHHRHHFLVTLRFFSLSSTSSSSPQTYFFQLLRFRFVFIVFACLTNILPPPPPPPPLNNERKAKQTLRVPPKQQNFIIIKSESALPRLAPFLLLGEMFLAAHAVLLHYSTMAWTPPGGATASRPSQTFVGFLFSVTWGEFHNICTRCDVM